VNTLGQLKRLSLSAAPKLAIGDGSLGFWIALQEEYGPVAQQRCWVHKTANILDKMLKSVQGKVKQLIHEIYLAPARKAALAAYDQFISSYQIKFQKPANAWTKIKRCSLPFTTSQPNINRIYGPPTPSNPLLRPSDYELSEQRLRFTNRYPDDGLQTWSGSPKALAPAAGIRTDSKGIYRCPFRRW